MITVTQYGDVMEEIIAEMDIPDLNKDWMRTLVGNLLTKHASGEFENPERIKEVLPITLRLAKVLGEASILAGVLPGEYPEAITRSLNIQLVDLSTLHHPEMNGLDIESEFMRAVAAEITFVIMTRIVHDIMENAEVVDFSFEKLMDWSDVALFDPVQDRIDRIIKIITNTSASIKADVGHEANVLFVSPLMVSMLQSSRGSTFKPATEGGFRGPNHTMYVGTFGDYSVYAYLFNQDIRNPYGTDTAIVAYRGEAEEDTGYHYSPHVLVDMDEERNLSTIEASRMVNPKYYRVLKF